MIDKETERIDRDEVLRLAKLARIHIEEAEADKLSEEFGTILNYVGEIKEAQSNTGKEVSSVTINQMREDGEPHESGKFTEVLLREAPKKEGQYIKVKKIL